MKMHTKLPGLIYAGCVFSLLLVFIVGFISLHFSERQKQKEQWVEHTYNVIENLDLIHQYLYEMAMDKQRHRIGIDNFSQSYRQHSDSLLSELNALNQLVADNPTQIIKVRILRQQIHGLLNFWNSEDITLKNANEKSVFQVTQFGKEKTDSVSLAIAAISKRENILLKQRKYANSRLRENTEFAIKAGTLLTLVLVLLLIYFIFHELKNRISAYRKERELNQLKSSFISLASHEFRTPLSSIMLSASLIEKYLIPIEKETTVKYTQKIKKAVNNLVSILDNFLSLEKLEAGKVVAVFNPFDLVELCDDVIEEMQQLAGPNQTLSFEHRGTETIVNLDANLVRNAMINLISNAIKYAGDQANIALMAKISDTIVVITIKDDGAGIKEWDQKNLFSPFYRVNNTGKIPGTGLGLNIVLRYVNLMKGKLSFSSIPYNETSFEMSFPNS